MKTNLYRVSFSLDKDGITYQTKKVEVTETKASYTAIGLRLPKESILKVDTHFRKELSNSISLFIFCHLDDIREAKNLLLLSAKSEIERYKKQVDDLCSGLKTGVIEGIVKQPLD